MGVVFACKWQRGKGRGRKEYFYFNGERERKRGHGAISSRAAAGCPELDGHQATANIASHHLLFFALADYLEIFLQIFFSLFLSAFSFICRKLFSSFIFTPSFGRLATV